MVLSVNSDLCDLVAVPIAHLRGSEDGVIPSPGRRVVQLSDGRFITTSAFETRLLEWSPEGRFLRGVGAVGEGPGEFSARGSLLIFGDGADSVYVLDGSQRWSVYGPDLQFARSFLGLGSGRSAQSLHVVAGRGIVSSDPNRVTDSGPGIVALIGSNGQSEAAFGPALEEEAMPRSSRERVSAIDRSGHLWLGPAHGTVGDLRFQLWSLDGALEGAFLHRPKWASPQLYADPSTSGEPVLPEFDMLHVDSDGLLWVGAAARDPRWRDVAPGEVEAVAEELWDGRIDVIEPRNGRLVASFRYDGPSSELPPFSRFVAPRTSTGYRVVEDALGLPTVEVFRLELVR